MVPFTVDDWEGPYVCSYCGRPERRYELLCGNFDCPTRAAREYFVVAAHALPDGDIWYCATCVSAKSKVGRPRVPASRNGASTTVAAQGIPGTLFANTVRRAGRPKLTKAERVESASRRRVKQAELMRRRRAATRRGTIRDATDWEER
jgi:hypothetical protein